MTKESNSQKSIAKSAMFVTIMMLSFKVLGFVKQAFIAYYYGATALTDAYFIAWGFVSGVSEAIVKALSVSIVAIYTSLRVTKGKTEAAKLINGLVEILFPLFLLIAAILYIIAPAFAVLLAPSYQNDQHDLLISFIRILSPVLLFGSLELIFGGVLDSHKSFYIPRLHSFMYSTVTILSCVFLSGIWGVKALVFSQYITSLVFTVMLVVAVKKYHSFFFVKINEIPELKSIITTAIPLFIGNSALQINQIVDKSITSGLGNGAASALSYCHTLEQFVTNIMIVNIGNVMFANFAEFVAKGDLAKVMSTLSRAINVLICMLFGISIITIVCSRDIVSIVYYRGSFDKNAVYLTSIALIGYAVSFIAVAVRDLSIKSLYAFKDTRRPMMASITTIAVNITFSLILSKYIGILGVSLATSISAVVGMIINSKSLKKYLVDYKYSIHLKIMAKCIPSALVLAVICVGIQNYYQGSYFLRFLLTCAIGLPVYFAGLNVVRINEINTIMKLVKRRLKICK